MELLRSQVALKVNQVEKWILFHGTTMTIEREKDHGGLVVLDEAQIQVELLRKTQPQIPLGAYIWSLTHPLYKLWMCNMWLYKLKGYIAHRDIEERLYYYYPQACIN